MDIHSTITQLTKAYKTHYKFSGASGDISHYLLLFYAVECGLKAYYLKDKKCNSTEDFEKLMPTKKHGHGHNIIEWQKSLKIPNMGYSDDKKNLPIEKMHERLRYGTFGNSLKEKNQVKFLKDLASHLRPKI